MALLAKIMVLCVTLATASHAFFSIPVEARAGTPIEVDSGFFGVKYRQNRKLLEVMSIFDAVNTSPDGKHAMGPAKGMMYGAIGLSLVGGGMIGFPLGRWLRGEELNKPVLYSGVGVVVTAMALEGFARKRLRKGVAAYNAALAPASGLDWHWTPDGGGLAVRVKF